MTIQISFRAHNGQVLTKSFLNMDAAFVRLGQLQAAEARTRECAPTDSGATRFLYNAEADALLAAGVK